LFDEFFQDRINHISRVIHRANGTQERPERSTPSLFAIRDDLIVLSHQLVMPIQRPIMVVPRNHVCGKVEPLANVGYQRGRNLIKCWEVAQTRKQFDPEHEIQLMKLRTGHGVNKAAFLVGWSIGFNQFFGRIASFHMTVNRSINRGHKNFSLATLLLDL